MKKLFLLLAVTFLFATGVNYSVLKYNNQTLLNTTEKIIDNKEWMDKFFSLSTYTYHDYSRIFQAFNAVLEAENVLLNKYVPVNVNRQTNQQETEQFDKINRAVLHYLAKSPDKLENVYYLLENYKKLIRIHNLFLDKYKNSGDYVFNQIYLTKYPDAQKYKFLQTDTLYYYFGYLETENDKTFNKFIKDLKQNTFWFLRYFGKSVKFADQIEENDL
jgi:hypothetical protein